MREIGSGVHTVLDAGKAGAALPRHLLADFLGKRFKPAVYGGVRYRGVGKRGIRGRDVVRVDMSVEVLLRRCRPIRWRI